MKTKPFGAFGETTNVPEIKKVRKPRQPKEQYVWEVGEEVHYPEPIWEPHLFIHGPILYSSSQGHLCAKLECEINRDPRNLQPIFDSIDRKGK